MKFETDAAEHFIRQVVRPGDALGVFEFSETVTRLSEFTERCAGAPIGCSANQAQHRHFDLRCGGVAPDFAGGTAGREATRDRAGHGCG